ncbi:MAG: 1,4-dihydroxy-6-naphthoate synthase [Deltaproteobacteria bacterium]|nr:1,4-dihydroxy-6-naphthoate synthase [Deltaproteobacteria bacterium]MBW1948439.1 1,4-dihydroxy-6-naphthoate synthase [Deltaproteobacteria bacterium]MBW2009272.1 1,4-dihydroxy-6-naphthoate synthase [Deltaproteobacteria bacterium]
MPSLKIGYSPCPNDTFIFAHLDETMDPDLGFEPLLADVEALNGWALEGKLPVTKISFFALGGVLDRYGLLRAGSALGRGCGPILVGRKGASLEGLESGLIAAPGQWTTARLLMGLYLKVPPRFSHMVFSEVMPAVARGLADYGLVIHEGRFTYKQYGLEMLLDLGSWWESETGLPLPLGGIAIRRDLGARTAERVDRAICDSLKKSLEGSPGTMDYVLRHSQEMSKDVVRRHIDLYVNRFSLDLGEEGIRSVETLFDRARARGLLPGCSISTLAYAA